MAVRITCITKQHGYHADPHHAIETLGWVNEQTGETGRSTREVMYNWILGGGQAFVRDAQGNVAFIGTQISAAGTPFVRTYRDQTWTDNLLALPECP